MTANKEKKRDKVFRLLEKSLGTDTDKSIAKKVGCSVAYVSKLRKYDFWKGKISLPVHVTDEVDPTKIGDFAYNLTKGGKPPEEGTYTRSSVLDTAKQYVTKDREATHGDMEDNFEAIAMLWEQYFSYEWSFSPTDVAMMMALLKIARLKSNKHNPDNYIDACGYMACAGELALKKVTKK
mgnify:FL=1|tara:strand:+ start:593 stop:1132 length:540 start_codon:yes stop_codon:yes gene_type:complete